MDIPGQSPSSRRPTWPLLVLLVFPIFAAGGVLLWPSELAQVFKIAHWFDPLFFQYTVLLWMLFVLLIPCITYFYVRNMREEREGRLRAELRPETWNLLEDYIKSVIQRQFGMLNYLGSTLTLMVVVAMGLAILFLLKPLANTGTGLDYSLGANLFLMGSYIGLSPTADSQAYFNRIVVSLTAFQFGFLGAYVYFIRHLVRSYFTLDLTPNTFVAMSVRMVTAGLIALVLSFALPHLGAGGDQDRFRALLPVVSFGIGFFPDWGLLAVEKLTRRMLMLGRAAGPSSTPLSDLAGMSYEHEVRLNRQGCDSIENIAEANLLEMALRTGFSYNQLRTWVGEAWLRVRFGREDYPKLVQLTGIRTADQFRTVFGEGDNPLTAGALSSDVGALLKIKMQSVARLVKEWNPEGRATMSAAAKDETGADERD